MNIMSRAVWPYHVLTPSQRIVERLTAERAVVVSHGTVRRWSAVDKFAETFANRPHRRQPRPGEKRQQDGCSD